MLPKPPVIPVVLVAQLILALTALPAPGKGQLGTAKGGMDITGNMTSFTNINVEREVKLFVSELKARTAGSYAGVIIERLPKQRFVAGAIAVPRFEKAGDPFGPVMLSRDTVNLKRGKYRVYLVADGKARVSVPTSDDSFRVVPSSPTRAVGAVLDIKGVLPRGHREASVAVEVPRRGYATVVVLDVTDYHQASAVQGCIARRSAHHCSHGDAGPGFTAVYTSPGETGRGYTRTYANDGPDLDPTGEQALFRVDEVSASNEPVGFYLLVDAPRG